MANVNYQEPRLISFLEGLSFGGCTTGPFPGLNPCVTGDRHTSCNSGSGTIGGCSEGGSPDHVICSGGSSADVGACANGPENAR